ncbi:hypothetical protein ABH14_17160 [Brevibacillus brevis]|uniref:ABC transporter permease n=1 Tax=Brevibacillus brevis TaxID=1393 RepID=UPI0018FFCF81|nr:ABC transporter permease [Brevibacillus brevis]MBH0331502.1 hypothetical protein [Brevibacillus brevis]
MQISTTGHSKWQSAFTYVMLLLIWVGLARLYPPVILPGPRETLQTLFTLHEKGVLVKPLLLSLLRLGAGFGLSFLLGTGLGVWAGARESVYRLVSPAVSLLQAIPPVSWMLLAILWLGVDGGAQIFVVALALFPVFFFNSLQGVRQLPRELLEMARVFGISRRKQVRDIILPALAPFWSAALTVNIGIGWKTIVMAELISGQTGIGAAMNTARVYLKTEEVMAWTLLVALLGLAMEAIARKFTLSRKRGRRVYDSNGSR